MDIEDIFEIKSYNFNKEYPLQKEIQMKIPDSFSRISLASDLDKDEVSELKSYNYNCKYINKPSSIIFDKNNVNFDGDLSNNAIFYDTNGISQDILKKEENRNEIENKNIKEILYVEIENKKDKTSTSDNNQENKRKQNINDIIFGANNPPFNEVKINNQKKEIYKVEYTNISNNSNNFIVFTEGNYDNFSSHIINHIAFIL